MHTNANTHRIHLPHPLAANSPALCARQPFIPCFIEKTYAHSKHCLTAEWAHPPRLMLRDEASVGLGGVDGVGGCKSGWVLHSTKDIIVQTKMRGAKFMILSQIITLNAVRSFATDVHQKVTVLQLCDCISTK